MEAKPFASLSSGLLARKGQAKPAMRPQGFNGFGTPQEDLGWNDMGFDSPRPAPADAPPVVKQQALLAAEFAESAPEASHAEPARKQQPRQTRQTRALFGHKAAFTLRLDDERHLRLRLASALQRRSSQRLVTEALDMLLNTMAGLDDMVAKAKRNPVGNGNA